MTANFTRRVIGLAALTALSACGNQAATVNEDALKANPTFAPIARSVSSAEVNERQSKLSSSGGNTAKVDANQNFYLALSKSSLGKKFFLSTYLTQYFPDAVAAGAARSMGTRIVTFTVQNDKLFVMGASEKKATSDTFDPTLIIEAYPLVTTNASFNAAPSASRYVLFDPSAGLNKFSLLSEAYGAGAVKFTIDLSFLQHFRSIADGATYEQVFTGQADQVISDGTVEPNLLRGSGTLGIAIRAYKEGKDFTSAALPQTGEYYFRNDPVLERNGGGLQQTAIRWNIHPGMKPIQWKISPSVNKFKSDPEFSDIDVAAALKAAVENWNSVFGFKAFEASVAPEGVNAGDDDVNYILFDEDYSYGAAFANWRTNPDTGEIRGASVYFSSLWLYEADYYWPKPAGSSVAPTNLAPPKASPQLSWNGGEKPLCYYPVKGNQTPAFSGLGVTLGVLDPRFNLTANERKAQVEGFVTGIALHEIGHTLGLRHNFEGSLTPPSSSVMDYTPETFRPDLTQPQAYDVAAVKYLYGMADSEPSDFAFCTDDSEEYDPNCAVFDTTSDPLNAYYGAGWQDALNLLLGGNRASLYLYQINGMMNYVAAPSGDAVPLQAYHLLFDPIRPPLATGVRGSGGAVADRFFTRFLAALFPADPASLGPSNYMPRGYIGPAQSVSDRAVLQLAVQDMAAVLQNVDTVRTFDSRRTMVRLLKQTQRTDALTALYAAQDSLTAAINGGHLSGDELFQTRALLSTVTTALTPFYP